ncbi:hypothetical protein OG851_42775 (plasmid) [Streptomyces sp. NBC_00161]|uniref:hypothetical protein n=1 Tax=Streptomyces sp. NBC_00161 TaxID=2975671 RepID=UPI002F9188D5
MYLMTLLTPDHASALNRLLALRMDWLAENGHPLSGESSSLMELVRLPEPEPGLVPVGMWDGERLVAAFAVQSTAPMDGWTLEERQEPSLVLSLAHTLPGEPGLGAILVAGLCDYEARMPAPPTWIRCTVRPRALAKHLEEGGWARVREVSRSYGDSHHLLQRPARLAEHTTLLVRAEGGLA